MRRSLALAIALLALTSVTRVAEAGLSARLVYLRAGTAEGCPDQSALKQAVARRLGYDPFLLSASHTVIAEVSGNGDALKARARLLDDAGIVLGSRELSASGSEGCSELLASLALAISLTLDPMAPAAVESEPAPAADHGSLSTDKPVRPSAESTILPRRAPLARTPPVDAPPQPKRVPLHWRLRAGVLATAQWVPALSPGASLGASVRHGAWELGLDAAGVASQTQRSDQGLSAKVSLAYLALSPCLRIGMAGVCAFGSLGRYAALGSGVAQPRAGDHWHGAAGVRLMTELSLSARWSLIAVADGVRTLSRPGFTVAGQEIFSPPAWAANLGVLLAWRIF